LNAKVFQIHCTYEMIRQGSLTVVCEPYPWYRSLGLCAPVPVILIVIHSSRDFCVMQKFLPLLHRPALLLYADMLHICNAFIAIQKNVGSASLPPTSGHELHSCLCIILQYSVWLLSKSTAYAVLRLFPPSASRRNGC
jgi:hypothetical protein